MMGKSKFPGKPSKLVHKKRISVLHTNETPQDNGNLKFSKTEPDGSEKLCSDSGKTSQKPPLQSCMKSSALQETKDDVNDDDDDKKDDQLLAKPKVGVSFDTKTVKSKKKTVTFKNQLETSDDTNIVRKVYNPIGAPLAPIIKKECLNRAIRFKRSSCIVRPSRLTAIVKLSESKNELLQLATNQDGLNSLTKTSLDLNNSLTAITAASAASCYALSPDNSETIKTPLESPVKDDGAEETTTTCSVLPKRSLHSKRVIKPNKRFLDGMISTKCRKKKMLGKKLHKYGIDFHNSIDNIWKGDTNQMGDSKDRKIKSEIFRSDFASNIKVKPNVCNAFGKVILREPKLNVTTFNYNAMEFLANRNKSTVQSNLILCNICGVISSFENPLQARKYGANCCEICRKFISKMIKKLAVASTATTKPIECTNGDGSCKIEPLQKNSPTKFSHNIFKERCQCCWLKRGLEIFHLPSMIRTRLINFLPATMRDIKTINTLNSFVPKYSPFYLDQPVSALSAQEKSDSFNIFASVMNSSSEATASLNIFAEKEKEVKCLVDVKTPDVQTTVDETPKKLEQPEIEEEKQPDKMEEVPVETEEVPVTNRVNRSQTKAEEIKTTAASTETTATPPSDGPKRQKIDLKGPRVKHVCRSASIVLGQPLATFGDANEEGAEIAEETSEPVQTPETIEEKKMEDATDVIPPVPKKVEVVEVVMEEPPVEKPSEKVEFIDVLAPPIIEKLEVKLEKEQTAVESVAENIQAIVLQIKEPPAKAIKKAEPEMKVPAASKPNTRKVINRPNAGNNVGSNGQLTSKNINSFIQPHHKQPSAGNVANEKPKNFTICIDFWENYDPVEVSRYGFGQIVAEGDDKSLALSLKAICFLCGSAGHDQMIFCVCCCEPYHQFCIDEYNTLSSTEATSSTKSSATMELGLAKMDESDDELGVTISELQKSSQESRLALLNWLCPRCTVCNSCNMTMGLKVKCQKCQKSYHNQCLGTNKRLFGADRPLICSNCLKCKSCGTTNVSKFVGNLPLCSACFRLRRKGNFCPLCQKCYEDNDFELKMMECGGCIRWVHARCEGLTDEQYNMLSVLPEHIEFICRKCSKTHEQEAKAWRDAVAAEFKTGLLNIVKLLSKSRQASAFLKLSPRKMSNSVCICICRPIESNRRICFNNDGTNNDEDTSSAATTNTAGNFECNCQQIQDNRMDSMGRTQLNLIDVKQKIHNDEYYSLQNFNYDMMTVIEPIMIIGGGSSNAAATATSEDLMITYKEILSETFPWFQNETKACTDALVEAMNDACLYNDEQMCGGIMIISGDDECNRQQQNENSSEQSLLDFDQEVPAMSLPDDLEQFFYTNPKEADKRICMFCKGVGEGNINQEERLLYCGQNIWVHTNCALWSAEVFEEIDGSLQNVHSAMSRGRLLNCSHCTNKGATVGCNVRSCGEHFHYPCARQINCSFLSDKTVYCPLHFRDGARKNLKNESNFRVNRPIYVEYDRKKKKYVEPREIQFLIGSLYVENIGRIIPIVSDVAVDCLIPCDYKCQRLYWSSKEPWRIVEYSIRTYMENTATTGIDLGKNFTIDHTLNGQLVQLGLAQISRWHNNLADNITEDDFPIQLQPIGKHNFLANGQYQQYQQNQYSSYQQRGSENKLRLDSLYSGLSMNNLIDENNEEEPQANNDLLPPEIKDAIFEDLPHDILDGISMLDIFPKLNYEDDLMNDKHENPFLLNVGTSNSGEHSSRSDMKLENSSSNSSLGDSADNNDINFSFFTTTLSGTSNYNLKRSNSDMISSLSSNRQPQRTNNLGWTSKIDSNFVAKKRKINSDNGFFGTAKTSMKVESTDVFEKLKISQLDGAEDLIEGPVMCDRCHCTYRTKDSYIRHLDSCDLFSTSESESENIRSPTNSNTTSPPRIMIQQQQPHQQHPNGVSTLYFDNANNLIGNFENIDMNTIVSSQQQPFQILNSSGTPIYTSTTTANNQNLQFGINQQQMPIQLANTSYGNGNQNNNLSITSTKSGSTNMAGSHTTTTTTKVLNIQNYSNQIVSNSRKQQQQQQQHYPDSHNHLTLANGISYANNITQQVNQQIPQLISVTLPSPQQQTFQTTTSSAAMMRNQNHGNKKQILPRLAQAPVNPMQQSNHGMHSHKTPIPKTTKIKKAPEVNTHHIEYNSQTLQPQTTTIRNLNQLPSNIIYQQPSNQQPILVQQMGQPNIMSYITTTGDQQNPTLQYVSIPTGNEIKTTNGHSYLTTTQNPMLQGTLQNISTDQNVGTNSILVSTPNGLQVIPNTMQIAHLGQPQVIGTLIQPQGIQCGMMSTEQMMQPQLEMVTDPASGCMYLTQAQPVYYGLETIVQNTVMSSQQFVSTAMQGMLSQNSSFSATTTQVFQSSKIEPIMEVPAGYVVLNNMSGSDNMNVLATQQQQQPQQPQQTNQNIIPQIHTIQANQQPQQQQQQQQQTTWKYVNDSIGKQQNNGAMMNNQQIIQTYSTSPQQQQQQQQQQLQQLQQQQLQLQQQQQQINENNAQLISSPPFILTPAQGAKMQNQQLVNKVQPQTLTTPVNHIQMVQQQEQQPQQAAIIQNVIEQIKQPQNILPKNITIISSEQIQQPQPLQQPTYRITNVTPKVTNIIRPIKNEKNVNSAVVKPKVVPKVNKIGMKMNQMQQQQPMQQQNMIHQQQPQMVQMPTPPQTVVEPIVMKQNVVVQKPVVVQQNATITMKNNMNIRTQQQSQALPNMPPLDKFIETNNRKAQISTPPIKTTTKMDNFSALKAKETTNTAFVRQATPVQQQQQQPKQIMNFNVDKAKPIVTYSNKSKINYDNMPPLTPTMAPRRRDEFGNLQKNMPVENIGSTILTSDMLATELQQQYQVQDAISLHPVVTATNNVIQLPSAPYVPSSTGIPTNIVNPLQQQLNNQATTTSPVTNTTMTTNVRPTNRVLPMQTIYKHQKRQQYQQQPSISQQLPQYQPDLTITAIGGNKTTIDLDKTFDSLFECSKMSSNLEEELKLASSFGNDITIIKTSNLLLNASATPDHNEKLISRDDDITSFNLGGDKDEDENTMSMSNQVTNNDVNNCNMFDDKISFTLEQSSSLSSDLRDEINKTPDIKEKISEILNNLDADDTSTTATASMSTASNPLLQFQQLEQRRQHLQNQDTTIDISLLRDSTSSSFSLFGSQKATVSTTPSMFDDSSSQSMPKYLPKLETSIESRFLLTPEPSTSTAATMATSTATTPTFTQQKPIPSIPKSSGPRLLYEIQSEDGFTYKSTSITEIWEKVFETVQLARKAHGLMPLPEGPLEEMKGHQMLGLKTNALRYLLEQLPGVEKCTKYKTKYSTNIVNKDGSTQVSAYAQSTASSSQSSSYIPTSTSGISSAGSSLCFSDDELKENLYGSARCEPYACRSEYDMFSWLASRHRKQPVPVVIHSNIDDILIPRRGSGSNLPMAMRYRTLKETSKEYVGVYRSHIHGRGLFCTRDIEAGEMVIEYAGELIRSTLTDKREKYYNGRGIGCYMFKIDENFVVDATMRGNAARFINHACEPNCYSKVVDILGHKHIIIFALRRLSQGEELTYDYKFPFEDEKIPCSCGSKKCRKYLN